MLLEQATLLVKEHAGLMKIVEAYDLVHPESGELLGVAREEPGALAKWLRLGIPRSVLPTSVNVYEGAGREPVLTLRRPFALFRQRAEVRLGTGELVATFQRRMLALGPTFDVLDPAGRVAVTVTGDLKGWNFRFTDPGGAEVGTVTRTWSGLARELLTSADNYVIHVPRPPASLPHARAVLLAAGLAVETLYKEGS